MKRSTGDDFQTLISAMRLLADSIGQIEEAIVCGSPDSARQWVEAAAKLRQSAEEAIAALEERNAA